MDHTLVDVKSLKNLEQLVVHLAEAKASLTTLYNFQVRSLEIGIMKEDMNERSNSILWDITRIIKRYEEQMSAVFELLPSDFDSKEVINTLIEKHNKKARQLIKKYKDKK